MNDERGLSASQRVRIGLSSSGYAGASGAKSRSNSSENLFARNYSPPPYDESKSGPMSCPPLFHESGKQLGGVTREMVQQHQRSTELIASKLLPTKKSVNSLMGYVRELQLSEATLRDQLVKTKKTSEIEISQSKTKVSTLEKSMQEIEAEREAARKKMEEQEKLIQQLSAKLKEVELHQQQLGAASGGIGISSIPEDAPAFDEQQHQVAHTDAVVENVPVPSLQEAAASSENGVVSEPLNVEPAAESVGYDDSASQPHPSAFSNTFDDVYAPVREHAAEVGDHSEGVVPPSMPPQHSSGGHSRGDFSIRGPDTVGDASGGGVSASLDEHQTTPQQSSVADPSPLSPTPLPWNPWGSSGAVMPAVPPAFSIAPTMDMNLISPDARGPVEESEAAVSGQEPAPVQPPTAADGMAGERANETMPVGVPNEYPEGGDAGVLTKGDDENSSLEPSAPPFALPEQTPAYVGQDLMTGYPLSPVNPPYPTPVFSMGTVPSMEELYPHQYSQLPSNGVVDHAGPPTLQDAPHALDSTTPLHPTEQSSIPDAMHAQHQHADSDKHNADIHSSGVDGGAVDDAGSSVGQQIPPVTDTPVAPPTEPPVGPPPSEPAVPPQNGSHPTAPVPEEPSVTNPKTVVKKDADYLESLLTDFFTEFDKKKLKMAQVYSKRYFGREKILFTELTRRYGAKKVGTLRSRYELAEAEALTEEVNNVVEEETEPTPPPAQARQQFFHYAATPATEAQPSADEHQAAQDIPTVPQPDHHDASAPPAPQAVDSGDVQSQGQQVQPNDSTLNENGPQLNEAPETTSDDTASRPSGPPLPVADGPPMFNSYAPPLASVPPKPHAARMTHPRIPPFGQAPVRDGDATAGHGGLHGDAEQSFSTEPFRTSHEQSEHQNKLPNLQPTAGSHNETATGPSPPHGAAASAAAAAEVTLESLLMDLYGKHQPDKIKNVPTVAREYAGKERELVRLLKGKYGALSVKRLEENLPRLEEAFLKKKALGRKNGRGCFARSAIVSLFGVGLAWSATFVGFASIVVVDSWECSGVNIDSVQDDCSRLSSELEGFTHDRISDYSRQSHPEACFCSEWKKNEAAMDAVALAKLLPFSPDHFGSSWVSTVKEQIPSQAFYDSYAKPVVRLALDMGSSIWTESPDNSAPVVPVQEEEVIATDDVVVEVKEVHDITEKSVVENDRRDASGDELVYGDDLLTKIALASKSLANGQTNSNTVDADFSDAATESDAENDASPESDEVHSADEPSSNLEDDVVEVVVEQDGFGVSVAEVTDELPGDVESVDFGVDVVPDVGSEEADAVVDESTSEDVFVAEERSDVTEDATITDEFIGDETEESVAIDPVEVSDETASDDDVSADTEDTASEADLSEDAMEALEDDAVETLEDDAVNNPTEYVDEQSMDADETSHSPVDVESDTEGDYEEANSESEPFEVTSSTIEPVASDAELDADVDLAMYSVVEDDNGNLVEEETTEENVDDVDDTIQVVIDGDLATELSDSDESVLEGEAEPTSETLLDSSVDADDADTDVDIEVGAAEDTTSHFAADDEIPADASSTGSEEVDTTTDDLTVEAAPGLEEEIPALSNDDGSAEAAVVDDGVDDAVVGDESGVASIEEASAESDSKPSDEVDDVAIVVESAEESAVDVSADEDSASASVEVDETAVIADDSESEEGRLSTDEPSTGISVDAEVDSEASTFGDSSDEAASADDVVVVQDDDEQFVSEEQPVSDVVIVQDDEEQPISEEASPDDLVVTQDEDEQSISEEATAADSTEEAADLSSAELENALFIEDPEAALHQAEKAAIEQLESQE